MLLGSLLVTLIMKQYDKISKHAELANYQQKAKLIFENAYLTQMCRCFKCGNVEMERNLMIITDLTNQGLVIKYDASKDPIEMIQETVDSLVTVCICLTSLLTIGPGEQEPQETY